MNKESIARSSADQCSKDMESNSKSDQDNPAVHDPPTSPMGGSFSRASGRLYKALRRKSSLTFPSKKVSKATGGSKKRMSHPGMDSSTVDIAGSVVNYHRPLPPSPPPSPTEPLDLMLSYNTVVKELEELQDSAVDPDVNKVHEKDNTPCISTFHDLGQIIETHSEAASNLTDGEFINDKSIDVSTGSKHHCMPLKDAFDQYDNHFPLRLKFMEGYCSEDSEHNLSTSEIYDVHFVKKTRVITLKDNNGFMHQISLASPMTFGLVYDPNSDIEEALSGHTFKCCSDIMTADATPPVVCATDVDNPDESLSISQNEILAVNGVLKPKFRGKRYLKVFSFLTYTHKLLPEEFSGNFTTKPSLIRLHPQQIVEYMSEPFPIQAIPYMNFDCHGSSSLSFTGVVTLCNCTTESSLVASPVSDNCLEETTISLHLNQDMTKLEVEVISWKEEDQNVGQDEVPVPQQEETSSITDIYDDIITVKQKASEDDTSSVYDDVIVTSSNDGVAEEEYATVGGQNPNECLIETEYDNVPFQTNSASVSNEVQQTIHGMLQDILTKLDCLEQEVKKLSDNSQRHASSSSGEENVNREQVACLNETEVGDLLKSMGLETYITTFLEEHVDGAILLQCDEAALRDDLGVSSKVHRLRLLKLIAGDQSIQPLLPTKDF